MWLLAANLGALAIGASNSSNELRRSKQHTPSESSYVQVLHCLVWLQHLLLRQCDPKRHPMLRRTIERTVLDSRGSLFVPPPTFLLPSRARYFNSTAPIIEGKDVEPGAVPAETPLQSKSHPTLSAAAASQQAPVHESIQTLLPLLRAQPNHYVTAHIHAKPYLLTEGDSLRLPFHMPGVIPGNVLRLNRASVIGSRDYTLKGAPYLDERLFQCRARVVGVESEPMRIKEKTKRRQRRVKTVKSKHRFTILKISELKINSIESLSGSEVA